MPADLLTFTKKKLIIDPRFYNDEVFAKRVFNIKRDFKFEVLNRFTDQELLEYLQFVRKVNVLYDDDGFEIMELYGTDKAFVMPRKTRGKFKKKKLVQHCI